MAAAVKREVEAIDPDQPISAISTMEKNIAASRALNSLLYGVGALDAVALIGALVTLALVAFIACYLPARRASMLNPIEAPRTE